MSKEYAEGRVREALEQVGGNRSKACRLLAGWAAQDPKLLLALTRAHLTGIVAYHVDRVASGRAEKAKKKTPPAKPQAASRSQNEFGQELIKALGGGAEFGFESSAPPAKRSQASQQHINAMKLLASRGKTQK